VSPTTATLSAFRAIISRNRKEGHASCAKKLPG
jgi:hypothetical protein